MKTRAAVVVLVLFSVGGALWLVVQSSFLDLEKVEVRGVRHTRPEDVRAQADVQMGEPLLLVRRGGVAGRVERLPWVRDARVSFSLPRTLVITIEERVAFAWVKRGATPEAGVAVVDAEGRVLDHRPTPPDRVTELGLDFDVPEPGRILPGGRDTRDAFRIVSAAPSTLRPRVQRVSKAQGWLLRLDTVEIVRFGPAEDVAEKWAALAAVVEQLGDRHVYLVDVRAPSVPAVREEKALPTTTTTSVPSVSSSTVP